ncbi:DEAD/DEAH box helicase [Pelistega indica]|uniref:DEAD-box ATP-dependent RNA helicase RhpA n=1 Tax=Pelistega indica TaxID=1414851 RepID=V8G4G3_9BURK|nr:DEAD/DEAH box helicase [Pelistega indica]ETD70966.1 DEAD/DEAH box helicase [Pelistega indica]
MIDNEQISSFTEFGLHPDILKAIELSGYTKPTPIQARAIGPVMDGLDVMGAAQTGTGKTAAFTLPVLHRMMPFASTSTSPAKHPVRALILTPTRELADQVAENVKRYSEISPLRASVVYGGVDINPQKAELRRGCEILIATPGRLLDHLEQKTVSLNQVSVLVLDEADRMLDMGFMPDLERILKQLPAQRQSLLFSATFSPEIRQLGRTFLKDPVEISVAANNATASTVTQLAYHVAPAQKKAALLFLLKTRNLAQVIVFANTKIAASQIARDLNKEGIKAESIHGDKSQIERTRTLDAFKEGKVDVLVATDVAARGLDVAGLDGVINFDLPYNAEDYVHRIGRTGRAGASGTAIAFYSDEDDKLLNDIQQLIKTDIPKENLVIPSIFLDRFQFQSRKKDYYTSSEKSNLPPIDAFFYRPYDPEEDKDVILAAVEKRDYPEIQTAPLAVLLGGRPKGYKK